MPPKRNNNTELRVLVAEDEETNEKLAEHLLMDMGHHVDVVNNGAAAVAAALSGNYDVILMDIQMPEMDGLTATQKIRESAGPCKNTPIISITANFNAEDRAAASAAGMDGFVSKPFRYEELLGALKQSLETRPQLK